MVLQAPVVVTPSGRHLDSGAAICRYGKLRLCKLDQTDVAASIELSALQWRRSATQT